MKHLMDFTRNATLTLARWRGKTVVLGRNQAMKMILSKGR